MPRYQTTNALLHTLYPPTQLYMYTTNVATVHTKTGISHVTVISYTTVIWQCVTVTWNISGCVLEGSTLSAICGGQAIH